MADTQFTLADTKTAHNFRLCSPMDCTPFPRRAWERRLPTHPLDDNAIFSNLQFINTIVRCRLLVYFTLTSCQAHEFMHKTVLSCLARRQSTDRQTDRPSDVLPSETDRPALQASTQHNCLLTPNLERNTTSLPDESVVSV